MLLCFIQLEVEATRKLLLWIMFKFLFFICLI